MKNIFTICLLIVFNLILAGSVKANEESVYPKNIDEVLYQRDLHGATQAYLWGQSLATSYAFMDGNLRVADYMDYVTYTTPFEKRFIITANMSTPYMVSTINLKQAGGLVMLTVPKDPT